MSHKSVSFVQHRYKRLNQWSSTFFVKSTPTGALLEIRPFL